VGTEAKVDSHEMRRFFVLGVVVLGCRANTAEAPPRTDPAVAASPVATTDHETKPSDRSGRLVEIDGHRVLQVWGSARQMGFAHGALLREEIIDVVEGYALTMIPATQLSMLGPLYDRVADIPQFLRDEAAGIVEGMRSAGGTRVDGLGRDLTAADLLVLNAMTDLLAIGCSSVSAWGPATEGDPALAGETTIVRNLDWSDDETLLAQQLVIAYDPDTPGHQRVVSVAFPGYIGCLSCINEAGVAALFNMGYGDGAAAATEAMTGFAPANLLLREALQRGDVDDDGAITGADVEILVRGKTHAGSYIVHVVEPFGSAEAAGHPPALILEVEADGVETRTVASPGGVGAHLLAATNHLRAKADPKSCSRYARVEDAATRASGAFDRDALWTLGRELRLPEVVHTMIIEPKPRRLTLWLRRPGEPRSSTRAPVVHTWTSLFPD
jgi:hypothetical protein